MILKKWEIAKTDKVNARQIISEYKVDAFLALILSVRGIDTSEKIERFFTKTPSFGNPFDIKDMDKAVNALQYSIDTGEKICIYADYDADGITSCVLLYEYLQMRGANVSYYIPNRFTDGYGLNNNAIQKLHDDGVKLLVTVDNGIVAFEQAELVEKLGMKLVVTDHHTQKDKLLPKALAVVNPHRYDCKSPFKDFSGVGVAFELILALEGDSSMFSEIFSSYFDILAIGTVADVVPLTGINRDIVRFALENFKNCERPGLNALIENASIDKGKLTARDIAFRIAPRINSAGRLNHTELAVELLLCRDKQKAPKLAESLEKLNINRKTTEDDILKRLESKIENNPEIILNNRVLIIWEEGLHTGVIGIVASRLLNKYGKPTVVISVNKEKNLAIGSGRSIDGFSLYDALNSVSYIFTKFGGHTLAAGFSMKAEFLEELNSTVNDFARKNYPIMPAVCLNIDCKINPTILNLAFAEDIAHLEPFGEGNKRVVVGLLSLSIINIYPLSNGKHSKLILKKGQTVIDALWFFQPTNEIIYKPGDIVDIAVNLQVSDYNNKLSLTTIIQEIRYSEVDYNKAIEEDGLYFQFSNDEKCLSSQLKAFIPTRNDFSSVFRYLKASKKTHFRIDEILVNLKNADIGLFKLKIILEAMCELGIIDLLADCNEFDISFNALSSKVNLDDAEILKKLKRLSE